MLETATPKRRRVHTPTVLQHEAVECGAASLTMVLHYYKCFVPLDQVRITCGVSRDGSNAGAILKAANHYGLTCRGKRLEPDSIRRQHLPVIVFWQFYHFVVVEGYDERYFYLNDPALGRRKVSHEEFSKGFTGVTLLFEPSEDFKPVGKAPALWGDLAKRLANSRAALWFIAASSLLLLVPVLLLPGLVRLFIDYYLVKHLSSNIQLLLVSTASVLALNALLTHLQNEYLVRLKTKLSLTGSLGFVSHVLRLPLSFFDQRIEGSLMQQVVGNEVVADLLFGDIAGAFLQMFCALVVAIVMFCYDVRLAALTVFLALVKLAFISTLLLRRRDIGTKLMMDEYKLKGAFYGAIHSIETLKATGGDHDAFSRWAGLQAKCITARQQLQMLDVARQTGSRLLNGLTILAVLWIGAGFVIHGSMTVGTLVAFQLLASIFTEPIRRVIDGASRLQEAYGLLTQLDDTMRCPVDPRTVPAGTVLPAAKDRTFSGYLELRDVTFGYAPLSPPLLEDFNVALTPGRRVAIVGPSGSGKSTVAKLIAGLYPLRSGQILFDGVPLESISSRQLSRSFAYVGQSPALFAGTVRENLTLWDDTVANQHVIRAALDACIHDEIAGRQGGYDCVVHAGGTNFSGGQIQRLEIARALVNNPSVIVLDEATSALDALVEERIFDNLRRRGLTTVVIAHRLSAIRDCDEIIVLENGKVVQRGTHAELVTAGGAYMEMLDASG